MRPVFFGGLSRVSLVSAVAVWVATMLASASPSSAKVCGGGVPCECGDSVQGVAELQADIGVCTENPGLSVASGAVLDCAGHTITGSDLPGAWYGISLDTVTGAQVRNCRVTAFRRGLRIYGGGGHVLIGNESVDNKYGIELAGQTAGNWIEGNIIRDNRDEGIHVGTGAIDNVILGNEIVGNKLENVYLLEAQGTQVVGNLIRDGRSAGIFVKHSRNSYIADNIVRDTGIRLRGDSWGNVLQDNDLRSDGYLFEADQDELGWTFPHDNQVSGGAVLLAPVCVDLRGAFDNRFQDVGIEDCTPLVEVEMGGTVPHGNVVELDVAPTLKQAERSALQLSLSARQGRVGDAVRVGLAAHNSGSNVPLDLYVGVFLPDGSIGFFTGPGVFAGITGTPAALQPMLAAPLGFSLTMPRLLDIALPPGLAPGSYVLFAAFVKPGGLVDGVVTEAELGAFDVEPFTVQP